MKKIFFSFTLLLNTLIVFSQADSVSINSFYDAIQLSRLSRSMDSVNSRKVLSILSRYNRQYNFKTTEIINIYTSAVKSSFSLDILFNWFAKNAGSSEATQTLGKYIKEYNDLQNKVT